MSSRLLNLGFLACFTLLCGVLLPASASACAVCFAGIEGDSRTAYILTTAFMTFMPLLVLVGLLWLAWRKIRQFELDQEATSSKGSADRRLPPPVV